MGGAGSVSRNVRRECEHAAWHSDYGPERRLRIRPASLLGPVCMWLHLRSFLRGRVCPLAVQQRPGYHHRRAHQRFMFWCLLRNMGRPSLEGNFLVSMVESMSMGPNQAA